MKNDVWVKNGIVIPEHELEISTSRAGGPGGQHVNKTETKITVRWNIWKSSVLTEEQKVRVANKIASRLTSEGDLIVHSAVSRSQQQNKEAALKQLAYEVKEALFIPKKRMKTKVSASVKEARLQKKSQRAIVKKMRSKKSYDE